MYKRQTEWYPTALALQGNVLYVTTGKGEGTGPNNMAQKQVPGGPSGSSTYIATLLHGSIAAIDLSKFESQREQLTRIVIETNMMKAAQAKICLLYTSRTLRSRISANSIYQH